MLPDTLARTVFARTVADNWRSLTGWAVGAALAAVMYAGFYPQLADGQLAEAVASYPEALREALRMEDLSSAAGYLGSSVFGLILPLIAMFYGAATGARAIAGDEETGHLDLLLAHPLSRTRLVLHRFAALTVGAFTIATLVFVSMLAIRHSAQLGDVSVAEFAGQCLNLALLGVAFGALSLGIGAATGKRGLVFTATAVIGVLTYALQAFANQLGIPDAAYLSPFHYYIGGEPLTHGIQWADAGVLATAALALVAISTAMFNRRDLNT